MVTQKIVILIIVVKKIPIFFFVQTYSKVKMVLNAGKVPRVVNSMMSGVGGIYDG